ncbi:glycosyltransferase family 4 protein [Tenacibaculum discolor]|uniref:glycosyltransferase family 4 protein n=1 Tax=Tenacibaculum discolor TaxID=361581 RepID=UPI000EAD5FF2|nr:glycosyltransferase family 4 protein [Tenacibaculum discolor]RLJ97682.1 glycosyltransferase involved in cell wall biosynthesis [Tenacibaculum discolor]
MVSKEKKIAFYIGNYSRSGGTERSCISVANGLAEKKDYKVYLIATNSEKEKPFFKINSSVELIHLNCKNVKREYFNLFFLLKKALNENKINVIVAVEVFSLLFLLPVFIFNKRKNLKLVIWEHFNFTVSLGKNLRHKLRWLAAKYADGIVVLTQRDKGLWEDNLKVKGNIKAINNMSPFNISEEKYSIDSKKVIAIGRLAYQKGFDLLIDLWASLIKENSIDKEWVLQIIGSGEDEQELKERIEEYDMHERVEMIPSTNNISEYYQQASFLAMTSRFEGLPMTLIEAQSFGLPIIAYDCITGPSEVISDNSGFLIEENNSAFFVEKIKELISNTEMRKLMSDSAKQEVVKYSKENVIAKWTLFLKELL